MTDNRPARCGIRHFYFSMAVYFLGLFLPVVRISDSVEGKCYEGTQLAWSTNVKPGSKEKVEAMLAPFPEAGKAECFVDPELPGRAYLQRPKTSGWLPLWVGGLAFPGFFYSLYGLIKESRRKQLVP